MATQTTNWSDTATCPFCGGHLADPGAGFVDHIQANDECHQSFDTWRKHVSDDLGGTWSG